MTDVLKTVAVLDASGYIRESTRMADATLKAASGPSLDWIDRAAGGMAVVGAMATGATASILKQGAMLQTWASGIDKVIGSVAVGDAYFEKIQDAAINSPFDTATWIRDAHLLLGSNFEINESLRAMKDLGDAVATSRGPDSGAFYRANYALAEMENQPLSMRQIRMLVADGVSNAQESIQKGLHLTDAEMGHLGELHIPGKFGVEAVLHGIEADPRYAGGMAARMDTIQGAIKQASNLWAKFSREVTKPILPGITHALQDVNHLLDEMSQKHISAAEGWAVVLSGPAMVGIGTAIRLWRDYARAKDIARIASVLERGAEEQKLLVLPNEESAVGKTALKWGAMGTALQGVGRAGLGAAGAEASVTAATVAGIAVFGAYAVIIGEVAAVLYELQDIAYHTGQAIDDATNKANAAADAAKNAGYDVQSNKAGGYAAMSEAERFWQNTKEVLHISAPVMTEYNAAVSPDFFTKKHKAPPHGVKAQSDEAAKRKMASASAWLPDGYNPDAYRIFDKTSLAEADLEIRTQTDATELEIGKKRLSRHPGDLQARTEIESAYKSFMIDSTNEIAFLQSKADRLHLDAINKVKGAAEDYLATKKRILSLTEQQSNIENAQGLSRQHDLITAVLGGQGIVDDAYLASLGVTKMELSGTVAAKAPAPHIPAPIVNVKVMLSGRELRAEIVKEIIDNQKAVTNALNGRRPNTALGSLIN